MFKEGCKGNLYASSAGGILLFPLYKVAIRIR
jgi:hypothetical protein